jgi:hypothetical protein
MYEELRELVLEAKSHGLPTVVWAYPRGAGISKEGETAVDVIAYAAQISCQLGAHVVKVKPPKDFIEQPEAKKVFEKHAIPTKTLADRVRHVIQSAFCGKRIVIFSGGEAKGTDTRSGRGANSSLTSALGGSVVQNDATRTGCPAPCCAPLRSQRAKVPASRRPRQRRGRVCVDARRYGGQFAHHRELGCPEGAVTAASPGKHWQ